MKSRNNGRFTGRERRVRAGDDGAAKHDRLRVRPRFARTISSASLLRPYALTGATCAPCPSRLFGVVAAVHLVGGEVDQEASSGRVLARVPARYRRGTAREAPRADVSGRSSRSRHRGPSRTRPGELIAAQFTTTSAGAGAQRRAEGGARTPSAGGDVRDVANARLAHVGQGVRGVRVVDALVPGVEHRTDHELTEVAAPAHDERAHGVAISRAAV